jgi:hypothetical protein
MDSLMVLLLLMAIIAMLALATMVRIVVDISEEEAARRVRVHKAYDGTLAVGIQNELEIAVFGADVLSKPVSPST